MKHNREHIRKLIRRVRRRGVARAALLLALEDNPDLPAQFIQSILESKAEADAGLTAPVAQAALKRCPRCRKRLPATPAYFYRDRTKRNGFCSYCKTCDRGKTKAWKQTHSERHREHNRRWAAHHPELVRAIRRRTQKRWRKAHPDVVRERRRRYYEAHPEKAAAGWNKWAAWKAAHPERVALASRRRTLHSYGLTLGEYDAMLRFQGGLCAICGQPERRRNKHGLPGSLCVEHDPRTKTVRGLTCRACNLWLRHTYDQHPDQFPGPRAVPDLQKHLATLLYLDGYFRPAKSYLQSA